MAEDIYTQLGIDKSKLKRDYIKNPLKRNEKIILKDLQYLWLKTNLNHGTKI